MIRLIFFAALLAVLYFAGKRALNAPSGMGRAEAARLLGLTPDAGTDAVLDAHRRLIAKVHPDVGGSAELAARINQARDTMLKP